MSTSSQLTTRRRFLQQIAATASAIALRGAFSAPGAFAAGLQRTAWVEEGPFYPTRLPLDRDNDLIIVQDSITPAVGEITHLRGRLLDANGHPLKNAEIEIWEVDHIGAYFQQRGDGVAYDPHFQGYGRFITGSTGDYYFRTIKPVRYPGRQAPHIHFKVRLKGREPWTTQLYIKGHPGNLRDGVYLGIGDAGAQQTVTVPFTPLRNSKTGELMARFDIVLGVTAPV